MKAVYPGSFDPVTNGHTDIIERAAAVFDEVIVAVAPNVGKEPMFTVDERVGMLKDVCAPLKNVTVEAFEGLLVSYVSNRGAGVIIKGLRAISDFEFEFEMALMNRKLNPSIDTVFMMTGVEHSYLSSSIVKEVAKLGGSVGGLVPPLVEDHLQRRLREGARRNKQW